MFDEPLGGPYDWPSELERRTPRLGHPCFWGMSGHGPRIFLAKPRGDRGAFYPLSLPGLNPDILDGAGGDVEVAVIKEGELMVYSGQRQFPLTYQMPESGLALNERRWNPDRPGGNVSLRSISATSLDVYTCGGATAHIHIFHFQ